MREEAVSLSWCAWLVTGSFALGLASDFSCGSKRWLDEVRLWVRFMNQLQTESKGVSNHIVENDLFSRADFFRCLRLNIMLILPWSAHRFIYFSTVYDSVTREKCLFSLTWNASKANWNAPVSHWLQPWRCNWSAWLFCCGWGNSCM